MPEKCCAAFRLYFHVRRFYRPRIDGLSKSMGMVGSGFDSGDGLLRVCRGAQARADQSGARTRLLRDQARRAARRGVPPWAAAAAARFAGRAETLSLLGLQAKAIAGLLIVDAETGETLFRKRNADAILFLLRARRAFTTALALAKLGPDYKLPHHPQKRAAHDLAGRHAFPWRCRTGRARRDPESLEPQISFRAEWKSLTGRRKKVR